MKVDCAADIYLMENAVCKVSINVFYMVAWSFVGSLLDICSIIVFFLPYLAA